MSNLKLSSLVLIAIFWTTTITLHATPIDSITATSIALEVMQSDAMGNLIPTKATDMQLALVQTSATGEANYYIFTGQTAGFVIVAGDDRAQQVLAYGDGYLDVNQMPDNLLAWLDSYQQQVEYLHANPELQVETRRLQASNSTAVAPMLSAAWDQEAPYYNSCPTVNGSHCLTGCPATSLAMVFHYWQWPQASTGIVPGYTDFSMQYHEALPATTFDWDNMCNTYTDAYTINQGQAVATLMRYVGQAEHTAYGTKASGIPADSVQSIADACILFGYDSTTVRMVKKTSALRCGTTLYTDDEWIAMMYAELEAKRPIVYVAFSNSKGGHAFNVDGCDATGNFHINWGWSGNGDGYFAFNAFADGDAAIFNRYQQMVIGIQPPASYFIPDVNGDGSLDISDVTDLIALILNNSNSSNSNSNATIPDVNGDGSLDISDVTDLIALILGNNSSSNATTSDVNGDGSIDISDVTELITLILENDDSSNATIPDVNGDGTIDISDVTDLISQILAS